MEKSDKKHEMIENGNGEKPVRRSILDMLDIPWAGMRHDLRIYPGPLDNDGQRSWVLEDPVRGLNFRLGYAEGEMFYRLTTEPDPDTALTRVYETTALRPSPEEAAAFIKMLQRERLANLPADTIIGAEKEAAESHTPSFFRKILQGIIFFRIPIFRPDQFLSKTFPVVSVLWSPVFRWIYLACGILGLIFTLQNLEIYVSTVNYLFTPLGSIIFLVCLTLLKIGHEFAHAYTAKSMGLHVRSMGIFFIVFWPLLYTDTTDAWKLPDRRRRLQIAAAGVLFELVIAGIALLLWSQLPNGILRSLMFFLSGASVVSTIFVNLNPFMRFDGYYILMDLWGVDNLRPRAFAMLRWKVRRWLLDWKGPIPEIHPNRNALIVYGSLALLYRLFIGFSIALAIYYLFFPVLGLILFVIQLWIFILVPLKYEVLSVLKLRQFIGSKRRVAVTVASIIIIFLLFIVPTPRIERLPCLSLYKSTMRMDAPESGRLASPLPEIGKEVLPNELLTRLESDHLLHEAQKIQFDLKMTKSYINTLGAGGEQGAYRNWLLAEEERLLAAYEKVEQAIAQLEIRAPIAGKIVDVNDKLHEEAFVARGIYLFTISDPTHQEVKAFAHEKLVKKIDQIQTAKVKIPGNESFYAEFKEKSNFPIRFLPNESLYEFAGGPIVSIHDALGYRPRDSYYTYTFDVKTPPEKNPHGTPSWIWVRGDNQSLLIEAINRVLKSLTERGII